MSGTASRFQSRFTYNPGMMVGGRPGAAPSMLPSVAPPQQAPATALPAAPSAPPAQTPVSAGSVPMGAQGGQGTGTNDAVPGMGENPGTIGGPNGMGGGLSYGTMGGALGTLAGLATGVPGLGIAGGGLGGYLDAREANGTLSNFGLAPMDTGSAVLSGATGGLFGDSAASQFAGYFAPSMPSSLSDFSDVGGTGGYFSPEGQVAVDDMNAAIASGIGPESAGWSGGGEAPASFDAGQAWGGDDGMGGSWGFMSGGYTGHGHPAQPAGTVHKGEVVIPAAQVARYGLGPLLALAEGSVEPSRLARLARG